MSVGRVLVREQLSALMVAVEKLGNTVEREVLAVNERVDQTNQRIDALNARLDIEVNQRFKAQSAHAQDHERRLAKLENYTIATPLGFT